MFKDPLSAIQAFFKSDGSVMIQDLTTLCSRARDDWASAAFSAAKQEQLDRYFSYQLQQLVNLPDGHQELRLLTDHLLVYFRQYIGPEILLSKPYLIHAAEPLLPDIAAIKSAIGDNGLSGLIKAVILDYLGGRPEIQTVGQLAYFKNFVSTVKHLVQPTTEIILEKLLELEFNHLAILEYYQGELDRQLHGKTPDQKINLLRKELQKTAMYAKNSVTPLDPNWPKLSGMCHELLAAELKALQPLTGTVGDGEKCRLELSVAHVACFLRLFVQENIAGVIQLSKLFQFVTRQFKTKRTEVISPGSLSKEYYSVSQSTAAEVRHLLTRMINRINRDYFPLLLLAFLVCRP